MQKYFSVSALSIYIYCAYFKHLANVFFVVGQKVIVTCFLTNLRFLTKVSPLINFLKIFYSGHLIPTPLLINFSKKILTRTFPNVYNTNFSTQNVSSEIFLQFVLQLNIKILCKNPFPMLLKLPAKTAKCC